MPLATHLHPDVLYIFDTDDLATATAVLAVLYDAMSAPRPVWAVYTLYGRTVQPVALVLAAN
jgi:hypothetical protein